MSVFKRRGVRDAERELIEDMLKREIDTSTCRWMPDKSCMFCMALVSIAKKFKLDFDKLVQEVRG